MGEGWGLDHADRSTADVDCKLQTQRKKDITGELSEVNVVYMSET